MFVLLSAKKVFISKSVVYVNIGGATNLIFESNTLHSSSVYVSNGIINNGYRGVARRISEYIG